jgi:hypothetical protein
MKISERIQGTCKVRNEIETKRNQLKRNETNRNETKAIETKRNQNRNQTSKPNLHISLKKKKEIPYIYTKYI